MATRGILPMSDADLRCRTGCGFYGNPQWEGYCSHCWREHLAKQKQTRREAAALGSPLGFSKFEEKKKHQVEKKTHTLRSILKKSPSLDDNYNSASAPASSPSQTPRSVSTTTGKRIRELSGESQQAKDRLNAWLDTRPSAESRHITRQMHVVHSRVTYLTPESMSELIHEIYRMLEHKIGEECVLEVEHYICARFYNYLFCPQEDEEQDLKLQARIRSLHWVCQGILDSGLNEADPRVREHLTTAITKIVEVTSRRSADDKLTWIVECSQELLAGLKLSKDRPASADEFLPALIFLLVRANPPLLQSNINFLSRYASPSRLMSGEQAYYFTNLCCAVSFIQNLSAESLRLTLDEFEGYMSGRLAPPAPHQPIFGPLERLLSIKTSLTELKRRQIAFQTEAKEFDERMTREQDELLERIRLAKEKYPLVDITKKLQLDADISPDNAIRLPVPLQPKAVGVASDINANDPCSKENSVPCPQDDSAGGEEHVQVSPANS